LTAELVVGDRIVWGLGPAGSRVDHGTVVAVSDVCSWEGCQSSPCTRVKADTEPGEDGNRHNLVIHLGAGPFVKEKDWTDRRETAGNVKHRRQSGG
jgi:hypothetical protein